jgi:K+-sensing histidine kinase KdpD
VSDPPREEISESARRLHDLRQPLAAIMAAASALRVHPELNKEERDSFLKVIVQSAERLSAMLEDPAPPA